MLMDMVDSIIETITIHQHSIIQSVGLRHMGNHNLKEVIMMEE